MTMQRKDNSPYETHWTRHAERYLALVHAALEKNPNDLELQELLHAMEATIALRKGPLH
jgi:hypothetical protein